MVFKKSAKYNTCQIPFVANLLNVMCANITRYMVLYVSTRKTLALKDIQPTTHAISDTHARTQYIAAVIL